MSPFVLQMITMGLSVLGTILAAAAHARIGKASSPTPGGTGPAQTPAPPAGPAAPPHLGDGHLLIKLSDFLKVLAGGGSAAPAAQPDASPSTAPSNPLAELQAILAQAAPLLQALQSLSVQPAAAPAAAPAPKAA